jgi:3-deoxy-manno-octulosonate cytidylyltransferase (CMP-KDO synthetase)
VGVVAVIPARYASFRFPGKLLAKQTGKYLLEHVYECVKRANLVREVIIATDDERIVQACDEFGASWRMTRTEHPSGTDRIAEVAAGLDDEIIVNVQGDEPEIEPGNIDRLIELLQSDLQADMATLASVFRPDEDINNPNVVKVVVDVRGHALYFSRWPIPYQRDADETGSGIIYRKHLGIYAYRREVLVKLSRLAPTPLEQAEKLEQLRALENGLTIAVTDVEHDSVGIDTPEQYEEFVKRYQQNGINI